MRHRSDIRVAVLLLVCALASCTSGTQLDRAREAAHRTGKLLMVEFGADWCPDCQVLTKQLNEPLLRDYVSGHFVVYTVDVGQFDKNLDLAKSLGVDVGQGIPTAAFLSADGKNLGATNGGELARASKDGSQTLYAFLARFAEGVTPPPPQPPSSSE